MRLKLLVGVLFFLVGVSGSALAQMSALSGLIPSTQTFKNSNGGVKTTPTATNPPLPGDLVTPPATPGVDPKTQDQMKAHYEEGMNRFHLQDYDFAVPDLIASTSVKESYTWQTWYIQAYNTLGIIYQFHSKDDKHKAYAYMFYSLALERDPEDSTASLYIRQVMDAKGDGENLLKEQQRLAALTVTPAPTKEPEANWYPAPPVGPEDQFLHYDVNSYFSNDVNGYNLFSYADIIARRRLDQFNTSAEFDVRFSKNYSTSDNADTLQLFTARISYSAPFLTLSIGRLDVGGALSPTEFFGNYMTMGLLRADGVQLTLPLSFKLGVQDLGYASSDSSALSLFYFPSLLSAEYASYNLTQAYVLAQLRIKTEIAKLPLIFRLSAGQSGSDYFQYSILSSDLAWGGSAQLTVEKDFDIYGEFGCQDANYFNDTAVVTAGLRINRIKTLGPFSLDELGIEGQFPLESGYNNSFTGANTFNSSTSSLPSNTFYAHAKGRISAVILNFYITNSVGDYTFGRLNSSNNTLSGLNPIGLTNQVPGLQVPLLSASYSNIALLFDMGVNF